jgi:PAS domain S-box-containing protein
MALTPRQPYTDTELQYKKDLEDSQAAILNVLEDHKKDSEGILQKKALDEAILASIGDGLAVVDKVGKITYVNQAFEKILGWKSEEILGTYIAELIPQQNASGDSVPFNEMILNKVLAGEVIIADLSNPFYLTRKDKSNFPASTIVTPIILDGEIIGAVKTFRDITKEKEIDKAKTEFVSLASHQLRTPLSTVNWYTEMLLAGDVGKLTADQERYLQEVYRGNQRMVSLVNALLSVSRMDLGTFVLEPEPTDFALLVQNVVEEQTFQIDRKKIVFSNTFQKSIPFIQADTKLLSMVVQNLLSNAVKYTPEKGTVALSIIQTSDKKSLQFKIVDSGYGIPKNQQDKIFTKLFRADNVREKDTEGTGLGLYIAKSIIDNSGGKLWFESKENKGSTFFVELPCTAALAN